MISYWKSNPLVTGDFVATLPFLPEFSPNERIMLVVPHPDDETLGCAGLIQRITAASLPFSLIMVSDGNRRGKMIRRKAEVLAAMAHCGVLPGQFSFLDYPDGKLSSTPEIQKSLQKELEMFKPTTIIVTDPEDIHKDHAVLGRSILDLAKDMPSVEQIWGILIHYYRFPRPLGRRINTPLLPPGRLLLEGKPWFTLPLNPQEQAVKRQAINEFHSQLLTPFLRGLMLSFDRPNELYRQLFVATDSSESK